MLITLAKLYTILGTQDKLPEPLPRNHVTSHLTHVTSRITHVPSRPIRVTSRITRVTQAPHVTSLPNNATHRSTLEKVLFLSAHNLILLLNQKQTRKQITVLANIPHRNKELQGQQLNLRLPLPLFVSEQCLSLDLVNLNLTSLTLPKLGENSKSRPH